VDEGLVLPSLFILAQLKKERDLNNSSFIEKASQVFMNTYSRFPIVLEKGEGAWVWDVEGNKYLDLVGGVAVNALGHNHPDLVNAITKQAERLIHVSNLYYNIPAIELAEYIVQHSFADKVFFCNSGAEANEGAIKLLRKYFKKQGKPQQYEVITFVNSFHGRTLGMISATGQERIKKDFDPLLPGFVHVPLNDWSALEKAINPKTAGVMIELAQGEGGVVFAKLDFLKRLRTMCDEKGLLLLFDEVQTGVGRTGKLFAYEHSGVIPDILTLAKGLAGGVPIGAVLAKENIAQAFQPGDHATTFGGSPFVTQVAMAVLKALEKGVLKNVQETGAYFLTKLQKLKEKFSFIQEARGAGFLLGLELKIPGKDFVSAGLKKGLLLNCTQEKVLRFVPPLILSPAEVDFAIDRLEVIFQEAV